MKTPLLFIALLAFGFSTIGTAQENLLSDHQMDDGSLWTQGNYGGTGSAVFTLDESGLLSGDNSMFIEVTGGQIWEVQFFQSMIPVEDGVTYYLSFMALAEEDFVCEIVWELAGDPYTKYYQETWTIVPGQTSYSTEFVAEGTDPNANFKFLLSAMDNDGKSLALDSVVLSTNPDVYGEQVSIEDKIFELRNVNVYPNPALDHFDVSAYLKEEQNVQICIYNIMGQKQHTLLNEKLSSGEFSRQFNAGDLSSGIYNIRISTEQGERNKLLIIK